MAGYHVYATVPSRLYRMASHRSIPKDKGLQRFSKVIVFNPGLSPGEAWDTQSAQVAAEAGKKLEFVWRLEIQ